MPLTKRERDEVAEMLTILNELRFVGVEREAQLEDLQQRAKELLQYSLFRDMVPEGLQGGLDEEDDEMSAYAGELKGLHDLIKPGYTQGVLDDLVWPTPSPISEEDLAKLHARLRDLPNFPMKFLDEDNLE